MEQDKNRRHTERMQRKKAVIDERISSAADEKGLLIVNTGNGKGKSSAAFGVAIRALGHGKRVVIVQFIKGRDTTGEEAFFKHLSDVPFHVTGDGFTWDTQNREQDEATAAKGWEIARGYLSDPGIDLLILDELNIVLKYHYLPLEQVMNDLAKRPLMQHVIVTGRWAPEALIELADTVTEMREVKHAFKSGIKAMPGIEF